MNPNENIVATWYTAKSSVLNEQYLGYMSPIYIIISLIAVASVLI